MAKKKKLTFPELYKKNPKFKRLVKRAVDVEKTYKVKLKSGVIIKMHAKDERDLYRKIDSGLYRGLGTRADKSMPVSRENIEAIQIVKTPKKKKKG